jgi:hypothetical protein
MDNSNENKCGCRSCIRERKEGTYIGDFFLPLEASMMILCPICGNKRCPHANNHENECTNSNETGQPGSAYP